MKYWAIKYGKTWRLQRAISAEFAALNAWGVPLSCCPEYKDMGTNKLKAVRELRKLS